MFTLPLACSFLVLDNYQHLFLLFILLFAFTFLKYVLCTFSAIFIPPGWLVYVDLLLSFSHFCSLSLTHTVLLPTYFDYCYIEMSNQINIHCLYNYNPANSAHS